MAWSCGALFLKGVATPDNKVSAFKLSKGVDVNLYYLQYTKCHMLEDVLSKNNKTLFKSCITKHYNEKVTSKYISPKETTVYQRTVI